MVKNSTVDTSALDDYVVHPAAAMFPVIDPDNLRALAEDIKKHGLQEPVWTYQGQLLDGRNRVLACAMVGIKPATREWKATGKETPTTFVMSRNLHRRHLSASQRAALAVELEAIVSEEMRRTREQGKATVQGMLEFSNKPDPVIALATTPDTTVEFTSGGPVTARTGQRVTTGRARDRAADAMRVSSGYVNDAKDLLKAAPDKFEQVKSGELSIAAAQNAVVREAIETDTVAAVKLRPGAIKAAMERIERENAPKRPEKPAPIRLPKASKVQSSATTLTMTVTFGNPKVAEEYLNQMQEDPRVLDLDYDVRANRPKKAPKRT